MAKLTKATQPLELSDAMETLWHKTTVHVYPVSDAQLAELTAGYNSIYLVFFGVCFGAAISLLITYPQLAETDPKRPYYFAALLVALGFAALSGIAGIGRYRRASKTRKRLEQSLPLRPGSSN